MEESQDEEMAGRMFPAGRMVLRLFLGSHGTLVVVSAPFMMPLLGHSNECSLYVL